MVGYNRMRGPEEVIDYYLYHPKWGKEYAFTRRYSLDTYNLVKGGIPVKRLLQIRSKNKMTMMLVKYMMSTAIRMPQASQMTSMKNFMIMKMITTMKTRPGMTQQITGTTIIK